MKQSVLFYIHAVTGLVAGIFIFLLSISGAALVFHDELDALQRPAVKTQTNGPILTVDSCYAIVQKNYPTAQISSANINPDKTIAFNFSVYDSSFKKGTAALQVFIHPQTGRILKTRGGSDDPENNFMSWVSEFHNSFKIGKKGEWLLGVFAVFFIISLLSGLIIYRRNIIPVLLFKRRMWKKKNVHQIIGILALLFNLMIACTGFWMQRYVFKKEFYSSNAWTNTIKASPGLSYNFDSAYHALHQQHPDFTGYVIYFAQGKKGSTAIYGSRKRNIFIHSKKFADRIMLDSTGHIASTAFVNEIDAGSRYDIINAQVHYGRYGGLPVKILYTIFGLSGAILSITGFILFFRRIRRKSIPAEFAD